MIPHPTVEYLLRWHNGNRAAARAALIEAVVERARQEAGHLGLSTTCANELLWPPEKHDCRNDGSTCLCECHD